MEAFQYLPLYKFKAIATLIMITVCCYVPEAITLIYCFNTQKPVLLIVKVGFL